MTWPLGGSLFKRSWFRWEVDLDELASVKPSVDLSIILYEGVPSSGTLTVTSYPP